MDLRLGVILLLACFTRTRAASFAKFDSGSQCSQQCTDAKNLIYEPGKTYIYDYNGKTKLSTKDGSGPEIEIHAKAQISVISNCELSLQLKVVGLKGLDNEYAARKELEERPILFSYQDGKVASVCPSNEDHAWAVNVKKAIISGLQISSESHEGNQIIRETDVLGNCETVYEFERDARSGRKVLRKSKNLKNCSNRQASIFSLFPRKYSTQGVQNLPILSNQHQCTISLDGSIIAKVECSDKVSILPFSWSDQTSGFTSEFTLKHEKTTNGIQSRPKSTFARQSLLFKHQLRQGSGKGDIVRATDLLREICSNVQDEIRPQVPAQFGELVYTLRSLPQQATYKLWQSILKGEVCSSTKLRDIFTDALVMDGSEGSIKVIVEMINGKEVSSATINYWLTLLAFSNQPTEGSIKAALQLIKNKDLPRQALLGVSSMVHNFCHDEENDCASSPIVNEVTRVLVQRLSFKCNVAKSQEDDVIVALRAIGNIAPQVSKGEVRSVLECAKANSNAVKIAAIEALDSMACHENVQSEMKDLFKKVELDGEVRIAAYKNLIQCPSVDIVGQILDQLDSESSLQVGSYIVSHLSNIQESSDPLKKHIQAYLSSFEIPVKKFPQDMRKYSRNYELSQHLEKINIGAIAEADVIFDGSFGPRSIKANLTLPLFGSNVNLIELGIRQKGLEGQLESLFGPQGTLRGKSMAQIVDELVNIFADPSNANEVNRYRFARSASWPFNSAKLESMVKKASIAPEEVEGSVYMKVDGKYIAYLSLNDLKKTSESVKSVIAPYGSRFENIVKMSKYDRAFSFMIMDSVHQFPGINGLPVKIDVNSTAIVGYKQTGKAIYPSFATELSVKVSFDARTSQPGFKWVTTVNSAPALQAEIEYKESRPSKITFALPKDTIELFHYKSDIFMVTSDNREKLIQPAYTRHHDGCTKSFSKTLGIELCSELTAPRPLFTLASPFVPLNGPINFEISLRKTDLTMKGWQFYLDIPLEDAVEVQLYRVGFLTPESRVDREFSAELQVNMPVSGSRALRLNLRTPFKQAAFHVSRHIDSETAKAKFEAIFDQQNRYNAEARFNRKAAGKKLGFDGEILLELPKSRPINIFGSVSIKGDRKTSLVFDFQTDKDPKRSAYIKGSVNLEGASRGKNPSNLRIESDIEGDLKLVTFKLANTLARGDQGLQNDLTIAYQPTGSAKQSLSFVSSVRPTREDSLIKYASKIEGSSTKWPKYNFRLTWNTAFKVKELIENDFIFEWEGKSRSTFNRKVKLIQSSQLTGLWDEKVKTSQNTIAFEVSPSGPNYKANLLGHWATETTPKVKIEFVGGNQNSNDKHSFNFEYKHESRKPLRLGMSARVRFNALSLDYADSLDEKTPGQYHGKSDLTWSGQKQASLDYVYSVRTDKSTKATQRGLKFGLKVPYLALDLAQESNLVLSKNDLALKTTGSSAKLPIWDIDSKVSRTGKSLIKVTLHRELEAELEVLPYRPNRIGYLKWSRKGFVHESRLNIGPNSVNFESDSRQGRAQLYQLSARAQRLDHWSVSLYTAPAQFVVERNPEKGKLDLKLTNLGISHLSTYETNRARTLVKSETKSGSKSVANLKGEYIRTSPQRIALEIVSIPVDFHSEVTLKSSSQEVDMTLNLKKYDRTYQLDGSLNSTSLEVSLTSKGQFKVGLSAQPMVYLKITSECLRGRANAKLEITNRPEIKSLAISGDHSSRGFEHSTLIQHTSEATTFFTNVQDSVSRVFFANGRISPELTNLDLNLYDRYTLFSQWTPANGKGALKLSAVPYHFNHESSLSISTQTIAVKSVSSTQRAQPLVKVDLDFTRANNGLDVTVTCKNDHSVSLKVNPMRRSINGEIRVTSRSLSLDHSTSISCEPKSNAFEVNSRTSRSNRDVLKVKAVNSVGVPFTLEINSEPVTGSLQIKLSSSEKRVSLKMSKPWIHETELSYTPRTEASLFTSTKRNGKVIVEIDSKVQPNDQSYLEFAGDSVKGRLEYQPGHTRSLRFVLNGQDWYNHETSVSYQARRNIVEVKSSTSKKGINIITVDSRLDTKSRSTLKIKADPWDTSFEVDFAGKKVTVNVQNDLIKLIHSTQANYVPRTSASLQSETTKNGVPLVSINIGLSRDDKSEAKVSAQNWSSGLTYEPSYSTKTVAFYLNQKATSAEYRAKITFERDSSLVVTYTAVEQGKKANLESELRLRSKSFLRFQSPEGRFDFQISPFTAIKVSKLAIDWKPTGLTHNSEVKVEPSLMKVKSMSSHDGKPIYTFDAEVGAFGDRSKGLKFNLEREQVKSYRHVSQMTEKADSIEIISRSISNGKKIWNFNSDLKPQGLSKIDLDSPAVSGQLTFDNSPSSQYLAIDATLKLKSRADRRIVFKGAAGPEMLDSFSSELSWDADRDASKRVLISRDSETSQDYRRDSLSIEHGAGYKFNVKSKMASSLMTGPDDLSVTYSLPRMPSKTVSIHHELSSDRMQCNVKFLEDERIVHEVSHKMSFTTEGIVGPRRRLVTAEVDVKSENPKYDGMHVKIRHELTPRVNSKTTVRVQPSNGRAYSIEVTSNTPSSWISGNFRGKVTASTPISGYRNQEASVNAEWSLHRANIETMVSRESGKPARFEGKCSFQPEQGFISASLDGGDLIKTLNKPIFKLDYLNNREEKSITIKADTKDKSIVNTSGFLSIKGRNIEAKVSGKCYWSPEYSITFGKIIAPIGFNYEATVRQDNLELISGKVIFEDTKPLIGKAILTQKGFDIFRVELSRYDVSRDEVKYVCDYQGPFSHKVTFQAKNSDGLVRYQVDLCPAQQSGCHVVQYIDVTQRNGREASVSYKNEISSQTYRSVWILKQDSENFENSIMIHLNGQDFGYQVETRDRLRQAFSRLHLAQRIIEARLKSEQSRGNGRVKVEFLADAKREPNRKATLEIISIDRSINGGAIDVNYKIRFGQSSLARPVTLSFLMKLDKANKNRPFDSKMILDFAREEAKQIVIESYLENILGNPMNKSISLAVYQPNGRKIDFGGKLHVALVDQRFTSGVNWFWVNRRSVRKEGSNFFNTDLGRKEFYYVASGLNDVTMNGKWTASPSANQYDVIGEMIVNGRSNKGQASFVLEGKCATMKVSKNNALNRKFEACLEPYRLAKITVDRYESGNQVGKDLSMALSHRDGKVLKASLFWETRALSNLKSFNWPSLSYQPKLDLNEIPVELKHKRDMIFDAISRDLYQPLSYSISQESSQLSEELGQHSAPIVRKVRQYLPDLEEVRRSSSAQMGKISDSVSRLASEHALRAARYAKENCDRSSACYAAARAYERFDLNEACNAVSQKIVITWTNLKDTVKVYGKISANYACQLSSKVKQCLKSLSAKIPRWTRPIWDNAVVELVDGLVQKAIRRSTAVYRSTVNTILANDDIRSLVNIIQSLFREIRDELKKIDLESFHRQSIESRRNLLNPKTWGAEARYNVWNPSKGAIEVELHSPVELSRLRSSFQSSQEKISSLNEKITGLKESLWNQSPWTPPFKAQALIIGGQHFVTFDRKFYDFVGSDCSYLLARDFANGNFSVMAKYDAGNNGGNIKKSIIVTIGDQVIEVNAQEKKVKIGKNQVELPFFAGSVSVLRTKSSILIDGGSTGINVECMLQRDICSVSISGWYFGKTKGLLGTYDYEPSNDMLLAHGRQANDIADLASGWAVEGACGSVNQARRRDEIRKTSKAYRLCERLFVNEEESPLSDGFTSVEPEAFFQMCLRHMSLTKSQQRPEKAACTMAAAYVQSVKHHNVELSMPQECLSCDGGEEFGSRSTVQPTGRGQQKADVVFIVQEKACNSQLVRDLPSLAKNVHKELEDAGLIDPKFGLVGFAGSAGDGEREAHGHTARGELFFQHHDIVLATKRLTLNERETDGDYDFRGDTFEAIALASQYPFRKGASKNLVLMTCQACDEENMRLDYNDVQRLLLTEGITLHVVSNQKFAVEQKTSKTKDILGLDARSVQRTGDVRSNVVSDEQRYLRSQVTMPKDVCIALAHLSNGSFYPSPISKKFDHRMEKLWSIGLARRIASTAQPHSCQHCDCIPDRDFLHSRTVCRPCIPLKPIY